jgi:hypothetical protein
VLHEFWYTYGPQEGLNTNYLYKNSRFPNRQ